jgi:hypothetical protein
MCGLLEAHGEMFLNLCNKFKGKEIRGTCSTHTGNSKYVHFNIRTPRLTNLTAVSRVSRECGNLDVSTLYFYPKEIAHFGEG